MAIYWPVVVAGWHLYHFEVTYRKCFSHYLRAQKLFVCCCLYRNAPKMPIFISFLFLRCEASRWIWSIVPHIPLILGYIFIFEGYWSSSCLMIDCRFRLWLTFYISLLQGISWHNTDIIIYFFDIGSFIISLFRGQYILFTSSYTINIEISFEIMRHFAMDTLCHSRRTTNFC